MADYKISNYGIFSDAINTSITLNTKVKETKATIEEVKTNIKPDTVFMGPLADIAQDELTKSSNKLTSIEDIISEHAKTLSNAANTYQTGDAKAKEETTESSTATTVLSNASSFIGNTMKSYQYDGKNFNVVNTKNDIDEYQQYIERNGLNQNAGLLPGDCMLLSQYYATDLLRGSYTKKKTMENTGGSPATRINRRVTSQDPQDVLDFTYNELNEGHPVVLQVTQKNPSGRHLVTAVGYDSTVTSAEDLTPEKILVLDCYDGKIQSLDKRNRQLKLTSNYQALGPTERFLEKEVN